jgi:hypothetical protein
MLQGNEKLEKKNEDIIKEVRDGDYAIHLNTMLNQMRGFDDAELTKMESFFKLGVQLAVHLRECKQHVSPETQGNR